jgi:reductive dehalogenase
MGKSSGRNFGKAASSMGYWRRRGATNVLALFIRNMGYRVLPQPDTVNVPLAIDAGIAEGGRHGRAVHPVFGGNYRPIVKVLTDMPLERDQFIDFGLQQFCEGCKLCAETCPSNTIPYGEKTWEYEGDPPESWDKVAKTEWASSKNPGVYHWYQEPASCLRFWQENGRSCGQCMYHCPFTQGRSWLHDVIRVVAGRSKSMDSTLVNMDKAMGYHTALQPEDLWDQQFLPYGISQDPLLGSF